MEEELGKCMHKLTTFKNSLEKLREEHDRLINDRTTQVDCLNETKNLLSKAELHLSEAEGRSEMWQARHADLLKLHEAAE